MRLLVFIILTSSLAVPLNAQNLDSLYSVWLDTSHSDSSRAVAFKEYIWEGYLMTDLDTAEILSQELIDFGRQADFPKALVWGLRMKGISYHYRNDHSLALDHYYESLEVADEQGYLFEQCLLLSDIGVILVRRGDYVEAEDCFTRGLDIAEKLGKQSTIAAFLRMKGSLFREQGNYLKALNYYTRCLKIEEELDNQAGVAALHQNIGLIYDNQGDYSKALDYYNRGLQIQQKLENLRATAGLLLNIGGIYFEQKNYEKALDYFNRSRQISEQLDERTTLSKSLGNIGLIYEKRGDVLNAMNHYQRSLDIHEKQGDRKGETHALTNIGNLYRAQTDYFKALDHCQRAYELALSIGVLDKQKYACECLYDIYKDLGKGEKALVYLEKIRELEDSMNVEETAKKLQQMEFARLLLQDSLAKAEEARKVDLAHQEEVRLEKQIKNWSIAGGMLFLLLAGGFYSRWRFIRKAKAVIERERDRSEHLLLNILPAEIAEELKEKGRADARDFDMVSILFTDFISFTEQSAKLTAAELVSEINACFEAFDRIIEKYNIEKIKTIGDAYMAAGGVPIPSDDSVKNTVIAALEMQDFIKRRRTTNENVGKPAFNMRVGIHTGPVVAGIVGVKKFQYDIWGDTVNTAARMESCGRQDKVNVSQATFEILRDDPTFEFESRGKVKAKGKGEVEMYFVSLADVKQER